MFTVGVVEAVIGIVVILVIGPVAQVVTLRNGFKVLLTDVRTTKKDVKTLVGDVGEIKTWIAVREDRERSE